MGKAMLLAKSCRGVCQSSVIARLSDLVCSPTHCVTVEEETKTSDQHDYPLIALPVDGLVDLAHADISILSIASR
jgi:hypothetical protein